MHQDEKRRAAVLEECRRRGIRVDRVGKAWSLRGPGVDLRVADLASVSAENLTPYRPLER